jgi:hypothetical protein
MSQSTDLYDFSNRCPFRIGPGLVAVVDRLRLRIGVIEEEDSDLLVRLLADIDTAVNSTTGG